MPSKKTKAVDAYRSRHRSCRLRTSYERAAECLAINVCFPLMISLCFPPHKDGCRSLSNGPHYGWSHHMVTSWSQEVDEPVFKLDATAQP